MLELARSPHRHAGERPKPQRIVLPLPPIGGKCWVMREKGLFVLEEGPGVLRTIACTHAGAGNLEAVDGVPDSNGFFPDEQMVKPADALDIEAQRRYGLRNGRPLFTANPIIMGSFMLDGGFIHGLTLRVDGGHDSTSAIASIVWMPVKAKAP